MKRLIGLLILVSLMWLPVHPQKPLRVTYKTIVNGREMPGGMKTSLEIDGSLVKIYTPQRPAEQKQIPSPQQSSFIDYNNKVYIQVAVMPDGTVMNTSQQFSDLPVATLTDQTEKIAGYLCRKATLTYFSNSIELWITQDAGVNGTPVPAYGTPEGLVLRVVRNNDNVTEAEQVEKLNRKDLSVSLPAERGRTVDRMSYEHFLRECYVTTVKVFDNDIINWEGEVINPAFGEKNILYRFAGGTIILKKVALPEVNDSYSLFAEVTQYSAGDAYDRTGTVFVIPQGDPLTFLDGLTKGHTSLPLYTDKKNLDYRGVVKTGEYKPPVELVRFFTPFGVRNFNERRTVPGLTWRDSAYYKADITHYLPLLRGEAWIGAFIGNYDKGGHRLSLRLKYYPETRDLEPEPGPQRWIQAVFNTLPIMEMAGQRYGTMFDDDTLAVEVDIPEGLERLQMVYISTGHGGWGGGDEFNQKLNEVFVDGKRVWSYIPWRTDCGTFRESNPASGNFWNGLSSSDYSRSGWCPGSVSEPLFIPLDDLTPGKHVISITLPLGKPEGGSFSHWNISGVLVGTF